MADIYLDYNATTPIDPQVSEAMLPFVLGGLSGLFGNPSSGHSFGLTAREGVDTARRQVASMLGCDVDDLIFTSGGTEANNHAIKGVAEAYCQRGNHVITTAVEHPAVTEVCHYLERHGFHVTYLQVDGYGMVHPQQVEDAITPATVLVTIMHANNEVGTVMPIAEIADVAHRHGALMHTDSAQSVGKIPVRVDELGVDLLSIAGHKLYAPKGIGALYIRPSVRLEKLMHGANHEQDRRAGTENIIEMAGLGRACELIEQNLTAYSQHMAAMRDRLCRRLSRSHRATGRPPQCVRPRRGQAGPHRGRAARSRARSGSRPWPAPRDPDRDQGHHRRGRHAHQLRYPWRRPHSGGPGRCPRRRPARDRRGGARKVQYPRVRLRGLPSRFRLCAKPLGSFP